VLCVITLCNQFPWEKEREEKYNEILNNNVVEDSHPPLKQHFSLSVYNYKFTQIFVRELPPPNH